MLGLSGVMLRLLDLEARCRVLCTMTGFLWLVSGLLGARFLDQWILGVLKACQLLWGNRGMGKSNSHCGYANISEIPTPLSHYPACLVGYNPGLSEGYFVYDKTSSPPGILGSAGSGLAQSIKCPGRLINGIPKMLSYSSFRWVIKQRDVLFSSSTSVFKSGCIYETQRYHNKHAWGGSEGLLLRQVYHQEIFG